MARSVVFVAVLACVMASVFAQPFIADITRDSSTQYMPVAPFDGSIMTNTSLYYGAARIPFNAWSVTMNITAPYCMDYSVSPATTVDQSSNYPHLDMLVSRFLPCSYVFSQNYASGSSIPNVPCYATSSGSKYAPFVSPVLWPLLPSFSEELTFLFPSRISYENYNNLEFYCT